MSKNVIYENPYIFTGYIVKAGLKKRPKDICKDRKIGTWKANDMEVLIYNLRNVLLGK